MKTVELLLQRGADVHSKNVWGNPAIRVFYTFSEMGGIKQHIIDLLVAHGADPEGREKLGP